MLDRECSIVCDSIYNFFRWFGLLFETTGDWCYHNNGGGYNRNNCL